MEFWQKYKDGRWQKLASELKHEQAYTCQWCAVKSEDGEQLHVHHGYYTKDQDPWEYPQESLWVLCDPCHKEAEIVRKEVRAQIAELHPVYQSALSDLLSGLAEYQKKHLGQEPSRLESESDGCEGPEFDDARENLIFYLAVHLPTMSITRREHFDQMWKNISYWAAKALDKPVEELNVHDVFRYDL